MSLSLRRLPWLVGIMLLVAWSVPAGAGQVMYVTDVLHVTIRSGPSVENKIIHRASTGDKFTVLETNQDGWARVRLPGGGSGWMISRYLQAEKPAALKLKELDPQNQSLLVRVEELTKSNRQLTSELTSTRNQLESLTSEYERLKKESARYLELKAAHDKLKAEYQSQQARLQELSTEVESLRFGKNLKWFLAGAGVLLLGWLMGLALGRRKRRWSSSLY